MSKGVSYEKGLVEADRIERKERRRVGDVAKATLHGQQLPDGHSVHERLWKRLENGVEIWVVNGRLVRSVFDIDFTAGGHDHVYEFVPEGEVWIDDAITEKGVPETKGAIWPKKLRTSAGKASQFPITRT